MYPVRASDIETAIDVAELREEEGITPEMIAAGACGIWSRFSRLFSSPDDECCAIAIEVYRAMEEARAGGDEASSLEQTASASARPRGQR